MNNNKIESLKSEIVELQQKKIQKEEIRKLQKQKADLGGNDFTNIVRGVEKGLSMSWRGITFMCGGAFNWLDNRQDPYAKYKK